MSYVKQGFTSGQTLKADHLNHIEDGIEALSSSLGGKVIILETTNRMNDSTQYFYNGEALDGNFVFDCLLSGYQFIIKYENSYYSVDHWTALDNGLLKLNVSNNGSLCPEYTITIE